MTDYDGFRVERDDERGVATITLDVPEKMNRVSMPAREQLAAALRGARRRPGVRVVVLTGAGEQGVHRRRRHRRIHAARARSTSRGSPGTSPPPSAARSR